jgi:RimJ/RimL family protein N-acetyltransferase
MKDSYDFVITEIATRNTRSIRAHEKVGFQLLHRFKDDKEEWDVVIWDWR